MTVYEAYVKYPQYTNTFQGVGRRLADMPAGTVVKVTFPKDQKVFTVTNSETGLIIDALA